MKYQDFLDEITERLQKGLQEGLTVRMCTVKKNNGARLKGLCVQDGIAANGERLSPYIYMTPFYRMYRNGRSIDTVADELLSVCRMGSLPEDSYVYFSFGAARKRLAWRLMYYDADNSFFREVPYRRILDFAIVYYLSLEGKEPGSRGSALVYKDHLKVWAIDEETLHETAMENTPKILPFAVDTLDHILGEAVLTGVHSSGKKTQDIYVISNSFNFLGAGAVFYSGMLKELSEKIGDDLFLLPSSINEFLALPASCGFKPEYLEKLVIRTNQAHLKPWEILSTHVYYYDREEDEIKCMT